MALGQPEVRDFFGYSQSYPFKFPYLYDPFFMAHSLVGVLISVSLARLVSSRKILTNFLKTDPHLTHVPMFPDWGLGLPALEEAHWYLPLGIARTMRN